MENLNIVDWIAASIMFGSFILAIGSGFFSTGSAILRTLFAVYSAAYLVPPIESLLSKMIGTTLYGKYLAFILAFVIMFILASILRHFFLRAFHPLAKTFFDRSLGAVFGFLRGILFCSMIFLGVTLGCGGVDFERNRAGFLELVYHQNHFPNWLSAAQSANLLKVSSRFLLYLLPRSQLEELYGLLSAVKTTAALGGFAGENAETPGAGTAKNATTTEMLMKMLNNAAAAPAPSNTTNPTYDSATASAPSAPQPTPTSSSTLLELIQQFINSQAKN